MRRFAIAAMAAILVLAIGGGQASAGGGNLVKARNFEFTPQRITISAGEKVTWKATEGDHTVTLKNGGLDQEISASGDPKVSAKFRKPGTYRYFCRFHKRKGMKGKVIVKG